MSRIQVLSNVHRIEKNSLITIDAQCDTLFCISRDPSQDFNGNNIQYNTSSTSSSPFVYTPTSLKINSYTPSVITADGMERTR